MTAHEVNFDGIVGPTHNYGGLAFGNVASMSHSQQTSNPKKAALQGLSKMRTLMDIGIPQAVLPPHERPNIPFLRSIGIEGRTDGDVIKSAANSHPELLVRAYSAAAMWTANAATVSPSPDCHDKKVHITPANLMSQLHRSQEAITTHAVLSRIFSDTDAFTVHKPLPSTPMLADEGAANHTRFCTSYGTPGVEFFVYGMTYSNPGSSPKKFPARQALEASEAIARLHQLSPESTLYAQQHPQTIDAGVFHNDVISVGNQNVFLYHESAFVDTKNTLTRLRNAFEASYQEPLIFVPVSVNQLTVQEAVDSYLFNSQIVSLPNGRMLLVAPQEALDSQRVKAVVDAIVGDSSNPIDDVRFFDLRESMHNGGGPACLRLRVVLTESEQGKMLQSVLMTEELHATLVSWVQRHYRDSLHPDDLRDPSLLRESRTALDELTQILELGSVYSFQK